MKDRHGGDELPSVRVELTGWLGFLLFVAAVYRLRQALDRFAHEG